MNKFILLFFIIFNTLLPTGSASGQGMSVNTTGSPANAAAMLDVSSTTKGFLPPRMTTAQQNAISSPVPGLMVYNTDLDEITYYSTAWGGWRKINITIDEFDFTGANQFFQVPSGITKIYVQIVGASGGGNSAGATVAGYLNVTPGQVLTLIVGGAGSGATGGYGGGGGGFATAVNGYGGGGRSAIQIGGTEILTAGGGGGGGAIGGTGGVGGATDGTDMYGAATGGGKMGTTSAGGAGGTSGSTNGSAGTARTGGNGGSNYFGGGGGGGGYFGGGGGSGSTTGVTDVGGGGGGSSFTATSGFTGTNTPGAGSFTGSGLIIIKF